MSVAFSPRKREILDLAAEGKTDKEIAALLGISVGTVHTHWKQIRSTLGVSSRTEAVVRVLLGGAQREAEQLERDRLELETNLGATATEHRDLKDEVERLKALTRRQAEFLTTSLANTDRKVARVLARLDQLEKLNELTHTNGVLHHSGEYGASWRKDFISESVSLLGSTPEQWVSGEVNFFDMIQPKYVERNIPLFFGHGPGTLRLPLTHAMNTPTGVRKFLDLLTCEIQDESGTGTYTGLSIDITEWAAELDRIAAMGWFKFDEDPPTE